MTRVFFEFGFKLFADVQGAHWREVLGDDEAISYILAGFVEEEGAAKARTQGDDTHLGVVTLFFSLFGHLGSLVVAEGKPDVRVGRFNF